MKLTLDACTAILLAKATLLETCAKTYELSITQSVYDEVLEGRKKMRSDALIMQRLWENKDLALVEIDDAITKKIQDDFNMGSGEASAIALSIRQNNIIATDNKQGRKAAIVNSIPLVGSPEIIVDLYRRKKISQEKAKTGLNTLQKEGWFSSYIIEKAKEDINHDKS